MTASQRFRISYSRWLLPLFAVLGLGPRRSGVDVGSEDVRLWMGWAFRARVPCSCIVRATPFDRRVWSWGVHGWRGWWLVNGSSRGLVELELAPPVRAWVVGFPIRLRHLLVSVDDRPGVLARVQTPRGRGSPQGDR